MPNTETLYVVTQLVGGYAREDAGVPRVVGAFSDKPTADKVKMVSGVGAEVHQIIVNEIPPGLLSAMKEYGITIP